MSTLHIKIKNLFVRIMGRGAYGTIGLRFIVVVQIVNSLIRTLMCQSPLKT